MSFETTQKLKECLDQLDTGKQDKITASGILKGNGSGGIAAADAAALKTLLDTLTSISPAADDKIPLTDISGAIAGYSTISDILALATGGAKIATGSYTGNGAYGEANPCSLTFGFVPKLVIVYLVPNENANSLNYAPLILIRGFNGIAMRTNTTANWCACIATWAETVLTWYNVTNAQTQHNMSGDYCYVAIG